MYSKVKWEMVKEEWLIWRYSKVKPPLRDSELVTIAALVLIAVEL